MRATGSRIGPKRLPAYWVSAILVTDSEFPSCIEVSGGEQLMGVLLDRVTHHCHIVECHSDSHRCKQSMKRRHATT